MNLNIGPQHTQNRLVRLGYLGVGWIGLARMKALVGSGLVETTAIVDPNPEMVSGAMALAPDSVICGSLDKMLDHGVDAVVIATPSALHAQQSIRALDAGAAVFCQKPLGRSAAEVRSVVEAARRNDLPLGVDLSYRHTAAIQEIRGLFEKGALGDLHAIDLVFPNGYGPDKAWFYDRRLSGGGCLIDLGIHLVDLALCSLDHRRVVSVEGHLRQAGAAWTDDGGSVEDLAYATLVMEGGALVRLACSWRLNVGRDAEISATFHGARASARFANVGGSFYDFSARLLTGTTSTTLFSGADDWGGRAALNWLERVVGGGGFDPACLRHVMVAEVLDRIYASAARPR
jgi:predicted dehydrogenase